MSLLIKDPQSNIYDFPVQSTITVGDVINYLKTQVPLSYYKLFYKGIELNENKLIKDLHMKENEYLELNLRNQSLRRSFGLPPREDGNQELLKDPQDFEDKIKALMELGNYTRSDCEKALRYSFYDINRACSYLLDGRIPDGLHAEVSAAEEINRMIEVDKDANTILQEEFPNLDKLTIMQVLALYENDIDQARILLSGMN